LNVQGAELDLNALEVVGYVDGGEEFTLGLSFVEFGIYRATFHPKRSGHWHFTGFFNRDLFKGADSVRVIAGAVSIEKSFFECPSETVASSILYCTIFVKDRYGNPTDGKSAVATAFKFFSTADQLDSSVLTEVMPAEMYMAMDQVIVNMARDDHGEHSGFFVAVIPVPEISLLSVDIFYVEGGEQTAMGESQDVIVKHIEINATASALTCPSSAVAGDFIVCRMTVVDRGGNLVGGRGMTGVFSAQAINADRSATVEFQFIQVRLCSKCAVT
jgi:hypothetical protein